MGDEAGKVTRSRRVLAVLLSLCGPPGTGHGLLGRWERGLGWLLAVLLLQASLLFTGVQGIALMLVAQLGALVDAVLIRPSSRGLPGKGRAVVLVLAFLLAGQILARLTRRFIVEPFQVPAASMEPTLLVGDHFMLDRTMGTPWLRQPIERGAIITFVAPQEPDKDFVKRAVARGGDTVAMRNGELFLNGQPVERRLLGVCVLSSEAPTDSGECQEYEEVLGARRYRVKHELAFASEGTFPHEDGRCPQGMEPREGGCVVPARHLFVLGDRRTNSSDSRHWGVVPEDNVKGVVRYIHFSLSPDWQVRWERFNKEVR